MSRPPFRDEPDWYGLMNTPYWKECIKCGCGITIQRRCQYEHEKSKYHLAWVRNPKILNKVVYCKCGIKYLFKDQYSHTASDEHKKGMKEKHKLVNHERVRCECGISCSRQSLSAHLKTLKHREFVSKQNKTSVLRK